MIASIKKFVTDMFCDHNGRWSHKKIGENTVALVWTYYMIVKVPESVEMWLAYATVLLTWSTAGLVMKTRPWEKKNADGTVTDHEETPDANK